MARITLISPSGALSGEVTHHYPGIEILSRALCDLRASAFGFFLHLLSVAIRAIRG
jgi:hypothetical protein